MDAGGDRGDGRVHVAVVGLVVRVEHHGDDEHDDVRRAGGLGGVERGPEAALGVDPGDELREPGLLAHVRAAGVDGVDDGRVDVDRDHAPAVARELRGERQAHLAGPDDGDGARGPGLARPGVDRPRRGVDARAGRHGDRAAEHRGAGGGAADDAHAARAVAVEEDGRHGGRRLEERGRDVDRPRAVLAVDVRPLAGADGADEGVELRLERLVGLDLDLERRRR